MNSRARSAPCRSSTRASVDSGGRIVFGATVLLEDLVAGDHVKYRSSATTRPTSRQG